MISKLKYQKIARRLLIEHNAKLNTPDCRTISWMDGELLEKLFCAFGGTKHLNEKTIPLGCYWRFGYVMDKLDQECAASNSIFEKKILPPTGLTIRPTRCFVLKEEHV